jgi:hypothetical protein
VKHISGALSLYDLMTFFLQNLQLETQLDIFCCVMFYSVMQCQFTINCIKYSTVTVKNIILTSVGTVVLVQYV